MPRSLSLVLADFVPDAKLSLNGRRRTHWSVIRQLQDDAHWHAVKAIIDANDGNGWALKRARVEVIFVFPKRRRRDLDNLFGRVKPLCDALVFAKVVKDDDVNCIDLALRSVVEPGVTETRITVQEIEEVLR